MSHFSRENCKLSQIMSCWLCGIASFVVMETKVMKNGMKEADDASPSSAITLGVVTVP